MNTRKKLQAILSSGMGESLRYSNLESKVSMAAFSWGGHLPPKTSRWRHLFGEGILGRGEKMGGEKGKLTGLYDLKGGGKPLKEKDLFGRERTLVRVRKRGKGGKEKINLCRGAQESAIRASIPRRDLVGVLQGLSTKRPVRMWGFKQPVVSKTGSGFLTVTTPKKRTGKKTQPNPL